VERYAERLRTGDRADSGRIVDHHSEVEARKKNRQIGQIGGDLWNPAEFKPTYYRIMNGKELRRELSRWERRLLVVQNNVEQRAVYLQPAVVVNETQLPEFIHEKIDAAARGANQFSQRLLRNFGDQCFRFTFLP